MVTITDVTRRERAVDGLLLILKLDSSIKIQFFKKAMPLSANYFTQARRFLSISSSFLATGWSAAFFIVKLHTCNINLQQPYYLSWNLQITSSNYLLHLMFSLGSGHHKSWWVILYAYPVIGSSCDWSCSFACHRSPNQAQFLIPMLSLQQYAWQYLLL